MRKMNDRNELRALGVSRILFGSLALLRTTPVLAPLGMPYLDGTSPLLGWPRAAWHLAAFGPVLPAGLVAALCIARTLALLLFTAGVFATPAGVAAGICGWVVLAQDPASYVNTLHLLFLGTVVLATSGAGSAFALRPEPAVDAPSGLALTRALVASVYAWSGLAKLNGSWLRGDVLAHLRDSGVAHGALADSLLGSSTGRAGVAWLLVATELSLGPLLFLRRTRLAALATALALHLVLELSMHPDFFGFAMSALLLSFVEPPAVTRTSPATPPSARATR
jgi:Vitamin K-dependent gamma-carboxylase